MKKIILLLAFISNNILALEINIHNLCDDSMYLKEDIQVLLPSTVADITLYTLDTFQVPYLGNEAGINTMINSPIGMDAFEYFSKTHYKSYGWCYSVDGVEPDVIMNQYKVDPKINKVISWYFGFAEFKDGKWITYCTPTHTDQTPFICEK